MSPRHSMTTMTMTNRRPTVCRQISPKSSTNEPLHSAPMNSSPSIEISSTACSNTLENCAPTTLPKTNGCFEAIRYYMAVGKICGWHWSTISTEKNNSTTKVSQWKMLLPTCRTSSLAFGRHTPSEREIPEPLLFSPLNTCNPSASGQTTAYSRNTRGISATLWSEPTTRMWQKVSVRTVTSLSSSSETC